MKVTTKTIIENGQHITSIEKFTLDKWQDFFTFKVTWEARQMALFSVPPGYVKLEGLGTEDFMTDTWTYWKWYLILPIQVLMATNYYWFRLARWFRRQGALNVVENQASGWFWPWKLKLPNRFKWCSQGGIHKIDSGAFYQCAICRKCGMTIYNR